MTNLKKEFTIPIKTDAGIDTTNKQQGMVGRKGVRLENIETKHPRHSHHLSHLSQGHQLKGTYTDVLVYENRSGALIAHFMGPYAVQLAVEFQNKQSYL